MQVSATNFKSFQIENKNEIQQYYNDLNNCNHTQMSIFLIQIAHHPTLSLYAIIIAKI